MKRVARKPLRASAKPTLDSLLVEYFRQNQQDHVRIGERLDSLHVAIARIEENVATHKKHWGIVATVVTAGVVGFVSNFWRNVIK